MQRDREPSRTNRQFYQEWLIVLAIFLLALLLRFWQLGELPPGLYHDEAFNGIDAVGVLEGERPLFFANNNGREPLYIYLVSGALAIFGRTAYAIRFPAALIGSLTIIPFYLLTKAWFNRRVALIAAFIWATTVWPIHLSRVGFRAILLPFALSLTALAATHLYRRSRQASESESRENKRLLVLASLGVGLLYGMSFYTYLAAQLTPLFICLFLLLFWLQRRERFMLPMLAVVAIGAFVSLIPLSVTFVEALASEGGRSGQVSILNEAVNGGDLLGTLLANFGRTLAMFTFSGDTILRHNPTGRPVFDWLMALPFLTGVLWCVKHWRKPAALACLLWTGTMLLGTILAEDAPHFLRAVGVLPVILIFPAIGLAWLLNWTKLPSALVKIVAGAILLGSCAFTINDYFVDYAQQPDTAFLFEAAARSLAEAANERADNGVEVLIDKQFVDQWQSVPFLLDPDTAITTFNRLEIPAAPVLRSTALFVWPHEPRDFVAELLPAGAKVAVRRGELARGDLQAEPFLLNVVYAIEPAWAAPDWVVSFEDRLRLVAISAETTYVDSLNQLTVTLIWDAPAGLTQPLTAFVHVIDRSTGELLGQSDAPPGGSEWPQAWWQSELFIEESRTITLSNAFDSERQAVVVGVYDSNQVHLQLLNKDGTLGADRWEYRFE